MKTQTIKGMSGKPIKIMIPENKKDEEEIKKLDLDGKVDFGGPHVKSGKVLPKLKKSFKARLKK